MLRYKAIRAASQITPPIIWNALLRLRGHNPRDPHNIGSGVITKADPSSLYDERFDAIYTRHYGLDPHTPLNTTRYRTYNICEMAKLCREVPGDFVCAGVSYGIAPRCVFDFADLSQTGKTLHLIDPFEGTLDNGTIAYFYNTDPDYVRRQYPDDAKVIIHRAYIPQALPLPGVERIAFAFTNTGNAAANAASLPMLYDLLSPGGVIVTDQYSRNRQCYDACVAKIGAPFWLPTGQGVFFKPLRGH